MIDCRFVYSPGVSGYNLAIIRASIDPRNILNSSIQITAYEWFDSNTPLEQLGIVLGYGANQVQVTTISNIPFVNITGIDIFRLGYGMFTDYSLQLSKQGNCGLSANGGELYMDDYGNGINTARLCINYGDDGAPLFLPEYKYNRPIQWKLAGILVLSSDITGCNGKRHTFTSTEFRTNWIQEKLSNFTGQLYIPPVCPSVSPTSTVTPTTSSSFLPQLIPSVSSSPAPSSLPFFEKPINLFWIIFMSIFLCLVVTCTFYWGYAARKRTKFRIIPGLQAILLTPPLGQRSSIEQAQLQHYYHEQQRRNSLAREGNLVDPPRRLSLTNNTNQTLPIKEELRHQRKYRRHSMIESSKTGTNTTKTRRHSLMLPDRNYENTLYGPYNQYRFNYTGYYVPTPFLTDAMIVNRKYEPISIITEEK